MLPKFELILSGAALFFIIAVLLYAFSVGTPLQLLPQAFVVAACLAASLLMLFVFRLYGLRTAQGRIWLLFSAGMLLWFGGELVLRLNFITSAPLLLEVCWIMGYILLITATWAAFSEVGGLKELKFRWALASSIPYVILLIAAALVVGANLAQPAPETALAYKFYLLADFALMALSTAMLFTLGSGLFAKPWLLALIAFVAKFLGDAFFIYQVGAGTYLAYPAVADIFRMLCYIFMALAAYSQIVIFQNLE